MKNSLKGAWRFLIPITLICATLTVRAQQQPTMFLVNALQKVSLVNVAEYEKLMAENWKPAHQLRKQNGKITNWALYRVRFVGEGDEYNYVSVSYYDAVEKTEQNDNWPELLKAANPKSDASAIYNRTNTIRTIVHWPIYERLGATNPVPGGPPAKYFVINYMEPKPGMTQDFIKTELEEWKPIHQANADLGKAVRWGLFRLVMPSGTSFKSHFVTSDVFSSYEQLTKLDYADAIKKVYPTRKPEEIYEKAGKTRDNVRTEIWELIMMTN